MDKLGAHIVEGFSGELGHPRLVKLVNCSAAYVHQVRAEVGPNCLIIVRWTAPEIEWTGDMLGKVIYWIGYHATDMVQMHTAGNVLFEGPNEVPDRHAAAYAQFEMHRLKEMHKLGLCSVVGNFSVGTPDLPVWQTYRPMLDAMRPGDLLGLHEYWSSRNDLTNPWHVGRWRLVPELANVPIVVTECGRDVVEGHGRAGWRLTCGVEEYLDDLRQYNALLMAHPNVIGATVFTGGRIYDQWKAFDVNDLWGRVIMEYDPNREVSPKPQPQPEQPTEPRPVAGFPVIDKVCMAIKNTDKRWYEASSRFGRYDGHPEDAEDWNLESGGNTDLGEPLVAPFNGLVINAAQYGGGYGRIVSIVGVTKAGVLVTWQGRHLQSMAVQRGQVVTMGQPIGTIGNADGRYAGAHLHEQIIMGETPGPTEDWRNARYNYVRPSEWYISMGVSRAMVDRLRKWDGK